MIPAPCRRRYVDFNTRTTWGERRGYAATRAAIRGAGALSGVTTLNTLNGPRRQEDGGARGTALDRGSLCGRRRLG